MKVLLCSFALVAVAVASDLSLNAQFAGFKHTHGKQYSNGIEEVSIIELLDLNQSFYFGCDISHIISIVQNYFVL